MEINNIIVAVAVVFGIVFVVRLLFSYFAYRAFIEIIKLDNERQDRLQAAHKKEIEASQARIKAIFSRSGKVGNNETDTEPRIPARRVISSSEARLALANDPESGFANIDADEEVELPEMALPLEETAQNE